MTGDSWQKSQLFHASLLRLLCIFVKQQSVLILIGIWSNKAIDIEPPWLPSFPRTTNPFRLKALRSLRGLFSNFTFDIKKVNIKIFQMHQRFLFKKAWKGFQRIQKIFFLTESPSSKKSRLYNFNGGQCNASYCW